jgi:mRNA-degrading endonuclease RelE of RelBE toxin-antitoxin system
MAPMGKKLVGNPYWSIHIGKFRVIYIFHKHSYEIEIVDLLSRKHDYREI